MQYRREIDGLRAVAVVPVILFHAGFAGFGGGYVGVDVFFVISGFLITTIIAGELQKGTFSIRRFYERRARRILPALFFVILCCIPFAWMWMLPDDLENFGQSIVATVLFSNNILLTLTSSYWDLASEFKALLHTWSLGVEEQYYIVFPLLVAALWRFGTAKLALVLAAIGLASLSAALLAPVLPLGEKASAGVFYLLPTRAWELLIGALAALLPVRNGWASERMWREILTGAGLALIVGSVVMLDPATASPGPWTLAPVLGATLILLLAGETTWVGRLLSAKAFVAVGLISYSAYLWHQPVLAFLRVHATREPGAVELLAAVALTFLLSALTWRYVEQPFRSPARTSVRQVVWASGTVGALLVGAGYSMHATRGFPERIYGEDVASAADLYISYNERVFGYKKDGFERDDLVNVLVLGNSFARDFVNMTAETLPMERVEIVYRDDFGNCIGRTIDPVFRNLYAEAEVVVFSYDWHRADCITEDTSRAATDGKALFYTGPKDFGYNLNWLAWLDPEERADRYNDVPEEVLAADRWMGDNIPAANYISLIAPVLVDGRIPVTDEEGRLLSPDRTHLTRFGAIYLGKRVLSGSAYADFFQAPRGPRTPRA